MITMNRTLSATERSEKKYDAPAARMVSLQAEVNYLISNTETIVDDGQEHGWD